MSLPSSEVILISDFSEPDDESSSSTNSIPPSSPAPLVIHGQNLDFMCKDHYPMLNSCENCCDRIYSGLISHSKNRSLLKKVLIEREATEKLKAELELLKRELNSLCKVNKIPPAFSFGDLHHDLYTRQLPKSLFSVCETAESSLSYMMKLDIFQSNPKCAKCNNLTKLQGRGGVGFIYKCTNCKARRDYKAGTFWEKINLQPNQILWFMVLWVVRAKDIEISHLMELSLAYVGALTKKIRKVIANEYLANLPVLSGIVEIDIKNFIKRKIEIGKSKAKERWVIILAERGRKLYHMEPIAEKKFSIILPIIQKRCAVGTVIITEAWSAYGRLENYGYPHYTLDASRGFASLQNSKIHVSNVYGQWAWIKYAVKRYNRICQDLGNILNEFQWRRMARHKITRTRPLEGILALALKVVTKYKNEDMSDIICIDP